MKDQVKHTIKKCFLDTSIWDTETAKYAYMVMEGYGELEWLKENVPQAYQLGKKND